MLNKGIQGMGFGEGDLGGVWEIEIIDAQDNGGKGVWRGLEGVAKSRDLMKALRDCILRRSLIVVHERNGKQRLRIMLLSMDN